MKNISTKLRLGFGIIVLILLSASIGAANPDSVGTIPITDDLLRSKAAFAIVEEEIAHHLNLGVLTAWDYQKIRGPVLLEIRTEIHFQLRQAFGRIVNTVDFGHRLDAGSPSQSPPTDRGGTRPVLHEKASEIIRDFIDREQISVIIMSNAPIGIREIAAIRGLRGEVRYTYELINGACVVLPIRNLTALIRRPFITEIWPNAEGNLELDKSVPQIGADKVHKALGVTGEGVYVAVIDTGIDTHWEFKDRIADTRNRFKPGHLHGTHVAGIIGAADDGKGITGVAPDVKFLDAQNPVWWRDLDALWNPEFSETLDAINWAVRKSADVVNMSQGYDPWIYGRAGIDPMSKLIDEVIDDGVVFIKSAGNEAQRRASGTIPFSPNFTRIHRYNFKVEADLTKFEVTLIWWNNNTNNLDLAILEDNGGEIAASRNLESEQNVYGAFYEQVSYTRDTHGSEEYFTVQVEGAQGQGEQTYEIWLEGKEINGNVNPKRLATFLSADPSETVSVPGYSKSVITVGNLDTVDWSKIANTSSQGPSSIGIIKPEIVAPGTSINSTVLNDGFSAKSGTSMAAPHVAGVAALILDAVGKNNAGEWNFSPHAVKAAIVCGAERGVLKLNIPSSPDNIYGAGLVKADNIIFGGTVPPKGTRRFEISLWLRGQSYRGYELAADTSLVVAISWQNRSHNLDLALINASTGETIEEATLEGSNYEALGTGPHFDSYYLDVINRSDAPVAFTGAATHPIRERAFPDLVVESPSVNKRTLEPGERFQFSATVRNLGTEVAHFTDLQYYRSSDADITPNNDTKVGDDRVKTLNPGIASPELIYLRAPEKPGTYYYGACVDGVLREVDTRNNCSEAISILVEAEQGSDLVPDLVVESPSVDKSVLAPRERFKLFATVRNLGTEVAHFTDLQYYRSSDAVITNNDTKVGDDRVKTLDPGQKSSELIYLRAPEEPGTYYYGACVDSVLLEIDTRNNCSEAISITVEAAGTSAPDLIVEGLTVDERTIGPGNTIAPGDRFQLEVVLRNQGKAAMTNRADLDYYYSVDPILTGTDNDVRASGDPINPLEPDATDDLTEYITAPVEPGVYYYGVCISDVDGEQNLANNCSPTDQVIEITVDPNASVVDGIDLYIPEIWLQIGHRTKVGDAVVLPDTEFKINVTVGNRGKSDDDYYRRRVYFLSSPDAVIEGYQKGNDKYLSSRQYLKTLKAGRTKRRYSSWFTAPEAPGIYYYGAEVEAKSTELNHGTAGNNVSAAATLIVNKVPTISQALPVQALELGTPVTVNMDSYFSDNESLTYTAALVPATPQVVELSVSGGSLDLIPQQAGTARVKVTAKDPYFSAEDTRWKIEQEFEVRVSEPEENPQEPGDGDIAGPDLIFSMARVDASTIKPGQGVRLHITLKNQGTRPTPATIIRYYRSTDATLSPEDTELRAVPVGALGSGKSQTTWGLLPSPFSVGTYYYGACVDAVADEFDTTNNCSDVIEVTVEDPRDKRPLVPIGMIPRQALEVGDAPVVLNVSDYFVGRVEQWDVSSSKPSVVTASLSGSEMTLTPVSDGWSAVRIQASRGDMRVSQVCYVSVGGVEIPAHELEVLISDANLRAAVRAALRLAPGDTLTQQRLLGLRTLSASGASISTLTGLEYARALTSLSLGTNHIRDLTPLRNLRSLTNLSLGGNQVTNIYPLRGLRSLTDLSLVDNQISDVSSLEGLSSLQKLWIAQNPIADLAPLRKLKEQNPSLFIDINIETGEEIDVSAEVSISDENLREAIRYALGLEAGDTLTEQKMRKLSKLHAFGKGITDLSGLQHATNLIELSLSDNPISDISLLANLTSLTTLHLGKCEIADISPLSNLRSLTELWLFENRIGGITPLANLTALQNLSLSINPISNIRPLANLTSLTILHLGGCEIADISPLSNLRSLTALWLFGNVISDISSLSSLTALTELNLEGNVISDISSLSSLTALTALYLSGNSISDISALSSLTALRDLDLSFTARFFGILLDTTPLESLKTLQSLVFSSGMTLDEDSIDRILANNPGLREITWIQELLIGRPRGAPSAPVLPNETALLPNYPNPFNPETWIPYQLATDGDVTLTIYDVRGIMVRRLVLGHQPAGFYRSRGRAAHWDGRNQLGEKVASGLYFYTFRAGDFTATQKLLIRK